MDIKQLEKYDYISFDIFDTLIKRNIEKPTDIFKIVEKKYNEVSNKKICNFTQIRISCEQECRKKSKKEISLEMIYMLIEKIYSKQVAIKLKKIEEEVEINFTQRNNNNFINKVHKWATENKKVILISDMYLSTDIIKKILKNSMIKYDKLYVSSQIGNKKSNSSLFKYVLKDLNIDSKQIFHIGDNYNSDKKMANIVGINTHLIPTKINNLLNKSNRIENAKNNNINFNQISNFINNNIEKYDYDCISKFGYECFGPLLTSFSIWLKNELKKQNINKVYFLARDGKIMKEIFDLYNSDNHFETYYLMASRRSIIVPSLWKCNNISEVFSKINIPSEITLNDLIKRIGLDDINLKQYLKKYNLNLMKKYKFSLLINDYADFFNELFILVVNNSKEEYKYLQNYLNKMNFKDKVAVVDIGWYGNMQKALSTVCDADIYGYYFGLRPGKKNDIITKGFLFDEKENIQLYNLQDPFNSIFEFMFSATHGSVKKFSSNKSFVELYDSENSNNYEMETLNKIQNSAIAFSKDYLNSTIKEYIELNQISSSINIFEILYHPNLNISKCLGNVIFKDGESLYIAKSKGIKNYIFNPKSFFNDLNNSLWKIGFLKNTFKVNLPYDKFYRLLKKIK